MNPERPWPELELLRQVTEASGRTLAPRMTIYPEFANFPQKWLAPEVRFSVLDNSDAEHLARDNDHGWFSGAPKPPPDLLPPAIYDLAAFARNHPRPKSVPPILCQHLPPPPKSPVAEVLEGVRAGQEAGEDEIVTLFSARGPEVRAVAEAAGRAAPRDRRR